MNPPLLLFTGNMQHERVEAIDSFDSSSIELQTTTVVPSGVIIHIKQVLPTVSITTNTVRIRPPRTALLWSSTWVPDLESFTRIEQLSTASYPRSEAFPAVAADALSYARLQCDTDLLAVSTVTPYSQPDNASIWNGP